MNRRVAIGGLVLGLTVACVSMASAQTTPLDNMFLGVLGALPLWARVFISVGGIGLAGGILYMLHAGPMVILGVIVGFVALAMIGAAANGTLAAWFGV